MSVVLADWGRKSMPTVVMGDTDTILLLPTILKAAVDAFKITLITVRSLPTRPDCVKRFADCTLLLRFFFFFFFWRGEGGHTPHTLCSSGPADYLNNIAFISTHIGVTRFRFMSLLKNNCFIQQNVC